MTDSAEQLAKTPLYDLHLEHGAKMVPFAGYEMPVQYASGIKTEHQHTRNAAGLFDVSHMGQVRLTGTNVAAALEQLVPVNVIGLAANRQRYAFFTNDSGGILDDLMITNAGDYLFLVINAACKQQDIAHLQTHLSADCTLEELTDRALLALQGPRAAAVMARFAPAAAELLFMQAAAVSIAGIDCFVTRSGYTGEDGFEISAPAAQAAKLAQTLLTEAEVELIGLGARDSLRLEAGLCLYGHDIDTTTTPVEAGLTWAIQKVRRTGGERAGGFPGAEFILQQLNEGVSRKRVGILPQGRAPVREGIELANTSGEVIGKITSGGFGPTQDGPVAMGYVASDYATAGNELTALVRGKTLPVNVVKLPFIQQRYYRG